MVNDADRKRLSQLDDRIKDLKGTLDPEPRMDEHYSQAHLAWRMVIELVAGLLIGFCIGYGLDWLFGTLPIFLVIFIMLGFAGGVRSMMRTATEVQQDQEAHAARHGSRSEKDE